jgi:phospholipid/cholesterol/gamma-HCH transport system substrate-binding protein
MTLLRDTDARFAHLPLKVGVFGAIALGIALALLLALAGSKGYFAAKTQLHFEAPSGAELRRGMAVKLSGFTIGQVNSIALNEAARVDVGIKVEDDYMRWIKADSVVSVAREGLIGNSYLVVTVGNDALDPLPAGGSLVFVPTPDLADIANDLRARMLPIIDGMNEFVAWANDPQGDLRSSAGEFRRLAAELRQSRQQVGQLIGNLDKAVSKDLVQTLATAERAMAELERELPALAERTEQSLDRLDEATSSAKGAADTATRAIESASPRLDRLLDETDEVVREGQAAVNAARKRWPFSGGDAPPPAALRPLEAGAAGIVPEGGAP